MTFLRTYLLTGSRTICQRINSRSWYPSTDACTKVVTLTT